MHEYPITQQIVKIASAHAAQEKKSKVLKVNLVVGDYSGFIGESIQMYFDAISEGTPCEGAEIQFERVKPKLKCGSCGEYFYKKTAYSFECPSCGGQGGPSEIGKEFYIDSIEVAD